MCIAERSSPWVVPHMTGITAEAIEVIGATMVIGPRCKA